MKKLYVEVSDEEFATLEQLAQALGTSVEELLKRSVAAYLPQAQAGLPFEPIGFGMWADRPEMQDAAKWVDDRREREWTR
jgi:hypothetical protein